MLKDLLKVLQELFSEEILYGKESNPIDCYVSLYLKYVQIFNEMDEYLVKCCHPKTSFYIKELMIIMISKIISLRFEMVDCNNRSQTSSSEYVNIYDHMLKIKIHFEKLELTIPSFLQEEESMRNHQRNIIIKGYMDGMITGTDTIHQDNAVDTTDEVITRNPPSTLRITKRIAIVSIQKYTRGYLARMRYHEVKEKEMKLIGMKYADDDMPDLDKKMAHLRMKRKLLQNEKQEKYNNMMNDRKSKIKSKDGLKIKNDLLQERIKWVSECVEAVNEIPESLDGFYSTRNDMADRNNIDPMVETPSSMLTSMLEEKVNQMLLHCEQYADSNMTTNTLDIDSSDDTLLRKEISEDMRKDLDETFLANLQRMSSSFSKNNKITVKKSKGKSKKASGKNGKKGRKEKPLPGEKIIELRNMDTSHMLSIMIESNLIVRVLPDFKIKEFVGCHVSCDCDLSGKTVAEVTSTLQLRNVMKEYFILPNITDKIKMMLDEKCLMRSALLYGPQGCGKTFLTHIVAAELGALVINLSPTQVEESVVEKYGWTKLIHFAFSIARDMLFSPVVIYIDDCDQIFVPKKSKKGAYANFMKELLIYKNQALTKRDRAIIIGNTSYPDKTDIKTLRWKGPQGKPEKQGFFEKFLFIPPPSYSDRLLLWQLFMKNKLKELGVRVTFDHLNYGLLAKYSEGYSTGAIKKCVNNVLSSITKPRLWKKQITEDEIINILNANGAPEVNSFQFVDFNKK